MRTNQVDLGRHTQPTILLVEGDDETRLLFKRNLSGQGYHVITAVDEEDALERLEDGCDRPDLILIDQIRLTITDFIDLGKRLRQQAEVASTPIVVMAERYTAEMEGKDIRVGDREYVTYLEDGNQLINLLQHLCLNSGKRAIALS